MFCFLFVSPGQYAVALGVYDASLEMELLLALKEEVPWTRLGTWISDVTNGNEDVVDTRVDTISNNDQAFHVLWSKGLRALKQMLQTGTCIEK